MVIRIQKIQRRLRNICLQLYVGCHQLDAEKSKSVFKHRNKETEENWTSPTRFTTVAK